MFPTVWHWNPFNFTRKYHKYCNVFHKTCHLTPEKQRGGKWSENFSKRKQTFLLQLYWQFIPVTMATPQLRQHRVTMTQLSASRTPKKYKDFHRPWTYSFMQNFFMFLNTVETRENNSQSRFNKLLYCSQLEIAFSLFDDIPSHALFDLVDYIISNRNRYFV